MTGLANHKVFDMALENISTQKLLSLAWRGNCLADTDEFVSDGLIMMIRPKPLWKTLLKSGNKITPHPDIVKKVWKNAIARKHRLFFKDYTKVPDFSLELEGAPHKIKIDKYGYFLIHKLFRPTEIYTSSEYFSLDGPAVSFWVDDKPVAILAAVIYGD